jgi:uncharacterized membrane protein YgcG
MRNLPTKAFIFFLMLFFMGLALNISAQTSSASKTEASIKKYIDDKASIISDELLTSILEDCEEIEANTNIRVFLKTDRISNLDDSQALVDTFFSDWIRNINLDKRGILLYILLPEGAVQGKIYLRVGIGLKYLITKEMGEKILNQVILPNNLNNKDGAGFSEGIRAIRRILLDEVKREADGSMADGDKVFDLQKFLWSSKEILFSFLIILFLFYIIYFVERCPRCNSALKVSNEVLKEAGDKTLGLQRKVYFCERCGFSRRKKEPIYPSGKVGIAMRFTGARRNVKIE